MVRHNRIAQFLRFCVAGLAATVTHVAVFVALVESFAIPAWIASVPAFLVAVTVSYMAHRHWTFRVTHSGGTQFRKYLLLAAGGALANLGITFVVVSLLGYWYGIAIGLALVVVPPTTFVLSKTWVFAQ